MIILHVYTFEPPSYALFLADKKNVEKSPNLNENIGKLNTYIPKNLISTVCSKTNIDNP